jgi:hypothetical protein
MDVDGLTACAAILRKPENFHFWSFSGLRLVMTGRLGLTFATKRVVDSERSATAVIGLSKLSS